MARCVQIPVHIIKSTISPSAKLLWMELSMISSPKRPLLMLHPETMAEKMGRSKRTIARLIKELEKAGLLVHRGYIQKRYKTYELIWSENKPVVKKPEPISTLEQIPPELREQTQQIFLESRDRAEFTRRVSQLLREHREKPARPAPLNQPGAIRPAWESSGSSPSF